MSLITSCDESESKLEQKIDDDKIELMCHTGPIDFLDGRMGRLGQVRSPFTVEYDKQFERQD
jgi:hypothetical protein